MKALSLTQPWAQLIAIGAKKIETRSWHTSFCGPVAIHAAKGLGPVGGKRGLTWQCAQEPFLTQLQRYADKQSWRDLKDLVERPLMPLGAIVATAKLVACVSTSTQPPGARAREFNFNIMRAGLPPKYVEIPAKDSDEYAFGNYDPGRFMWFLGDVRMLHKPIHCKGALGLWEVPPEIAASLSDLKAA